MIDLEERFDTVEEMQAFLKGIVPQSIYDDIIQLQDDVASLKAQEIIANTDLNDLDVGIYIIPSTAVANSLLNKPNAGSATGFIRVLSAGSAGQKIMYYKPCINSPTYYFRAYYSGAWINWQTVDLTETEWFDLLLTSAAIAFNEEQKPRYRKIGKTVFIAGVVKGVSSNDVVIASLPEGFRPSKRTIFANASSDGSTSSFTLYPNGNIGLNRNSSVPTITAGQWHSLACSFCI